MTDPITDHGGSGMGERETRCPVCNDDGWIETWVEGPDGHYYPSSGECPRLNDPEHAPFNATGLLPETFSPVQGPSEGDQ